MDLPNATRAVVASARDLGLEIEVAEFPEGTKTAVDAANAIGCDVGAIVKSLVFTVDDDPVVALVPGDRRLDTEKLGAISNGHKVQRAALEVARSATGFAAGGTPPFGYANELPVYADNHLRRHDPVWAAAGTPTTVFPISIADLDGLVDPEWVDISQ